MKATAVLAAGRMRTYEEQLDADLNCAFTEGSLHFEKRSQVHFTMRRICERLRAISVPYAIAGPMALFIYGYRRYSEAVDVVVSLEGLSKLRRAHPAIKLVQTRLTEYQFRDLENGVLVRLRVNDVTIRDCFEYEGLNYLSLPAVIENLLAERKSSADSDVQEAIKRLALPLELAENFSATRRARYAEIWRPVRDRPPLYFRRIPVETPMSSDADWDDCLRASSKHAEELRQLRDAGATFETCPGDPFTAYLLTRNLELARKHGFEFENDV